MVWGSRIVLGHAGPVGADAAVFEEHFCVFVVWLGSGGDICDDGLADWVGVVSWADDAGFEEAY